MTVTEPGNGYSTAHLEAGAVHHNPHGFVHGATVFAMVDTSMGAAATSILSENQRCSTIELQIRFLRPVVEGALRAETNVVKPGRRIIHLESRVTDAADRLIATATASFAVIDDPDF